ncbi:MAG: Gfo/Idh/MocA family oxidoreductase [Candidatus Nealsonbacteria bacterium]|nr:Gfo/Idh/MocA family oxidoreductase [Candidatus Nealsonbacteria bacterium]
MTDVKKLSRRRFLRQSGALAAAGVATPCLIPREVLGLADTPGANDRIGIGGIGIGRQGSGVLGGSSREGRVVAIADINEPRAKQTAAKYKAEAYTDYRKLLERKDIDAIVTATPDHWRARVCIHAAQAGKDIYAEKPLCLTIKEGRAIANAVRKHKRVFQTGSQQRSLSANRRACELIRNGYIGKVHTVIGSNYPSPWRMDLPGQDAPAGLDWNEWCGPAPLVPYNIDLYTPRRKPGWISVWPYSGGEMTGWGAHGLDQIQWALGADEGGPLEVWCEDGKYEMPTFKEPVGSGQLNGLFGGKHKVHYRYPNDVEVTLDNGSGAGGIFIGDKGKIEIHRGNFKSNPAELAKVELKSTDERLYESNNHMQNWLDCMRTRKRCIADVEIGHRSCTVCHLGNIARLAGRKLKWDPIKEIFPDDDEANKYLDVARRKGYELPEPV